MSHQSIILDTNTLINFLRGERLEMDLVENKTLCIS